MKKYISFEGQKGTGYVGENIHFRIYVFSSVLFTKQCLRFLLICFVREIKGFCHSSLGNEVDFGDILNVPPYILAKNYNFKNLRHDFVEERAPITTTLITPFHWKTLVPFSL